MSRESRLQAAIALNTVIVIAQVVVGLLAHSLGLLADAGHNLTDVAAVSLSLIAIRWARRPATASRTFGYHRATILAAMANAASILAVTVYITVEAVRRLQDPPEVAGGLVVVVALIAFAANSVAALLLREHAHAGPADLNMRSAMLHTVSDAGASLVVAVAGGVILATGGWFWLDPAGALLVALLIAWHAWRLLCESVSVLLESTPAGLDTAGLAAAMRAAPGIADVHDLHVWSLSSSMHALSAHLVLEGHPTLECAQTTADHVREVVRGPYGIAHATLELECEPCDPVNKEDCLAPTAPAAARRHGTSSSRNAG